MKIQQIHLDTQKISVTVRSKYFHYENFLEICALKCWKLSSEGQKFPFKNRTVSNFCSRYIYNNKTKECINCIPFSWFEKNPDTNVYVALDGIFII